MARGRLILAGLLALLAALPVGARAEAAWFGYNDNATLTGQFTPDRDADLLAWAGAGSARIDVDWSWVERRPGALDLSMYDPIYAAMLKRGVRPLLNLMGSPRWAWPIWVLCFPVSDCHVAPDRSHDAAWGRFAAEVARRYPEAAGIEVWNEPNLQVFFRPHPDPARYTELLRIAHDAIKGVAPSMPVLGGALSPVLGDPPGQDMGMRRFLQGMYAAGARGAMDGLSVHPYPHGRADGGVYEAMDTVLEARDDAGDPVPLWLTELGVSSAGLGASEIDQALTLADLVPRLLRRPEVAGVYLHTLADSRGLPLTAEDGFGVLRYGGQAKLAFCAVIRALKGQSPCWAPSPPAATTARWNAQEQLQSAVEGALAHRRATGSYAGLTSADLHAASPTLSADPAALDSLPGAGADPARIAVLTAPGAADGVRLCNASRESRSYCITVVHGGSWGFTAAQGSIADAVAATDAGTAERW